MTLPIKPFGNEDIWNSSYTPLGANESFVGSIRKGLEDRYILLIQSFSDVPGTVFIDFSTDGRVFDTTYPINGYQAKGNAAGVHYVIIGGRFWRLRYVNGDQVQSVLRVACYEVQFDSLAECFSNPVDLFTDAQPVRPSITEDEIITGKRPGIAAFEMFGCRVDGAPASGEQTVWTDPTNFSVMLVPDTFTITYNALTDGANPVATGAKKLFFLYIDADGVLQDAEHELGDTGTDVTAFSGLGINRVFLLQSGTSDININDITISDTAAVKGVQSIIPATFSISQGMIYHVPKDSTAIVKRVFLNCIVLMGVAPQVVIRGKIFSRVLGNILAEFNYYVDAAITNMQPIADPVGFPVLGDSVIIFTTETTKNATITSLRTSINLYDDT